MQLVFGRDAIFNIPFVADWDYIRQRKQHIIHDNNRWENAKHIAPTYQVGDKILKKVENNTKYGGPEYEGPYVITDVYDNGTVRIRKNTFIDTINIRQIKPYKDSELALIMGASAIYIRYASENVS